MRLARLRSRLVAIAAGLVVWAGAATARCDRLEWRSSWRRVGAVEYVATAGLLGGYFALRWLVEPSAAAAWSRPILIDRPVRRLLAQSSRSGRDTADALSDGVNLGLVAQNIVVDAGAVAWLEAGAGDVAWQLFVIDSQSYALSMVLNTATKRLVARARPYAADCEDDREHVRECGQKDTYRAFYSNHASLTATSAGLSCAHHTQLALYGAGAADAAACAAGVSLSLFAGVLRIAADEHWATDVIAGWTIGALAGYLLPTLVYYDGPRSSPAETAEPVPAPAGAAPLIWAAEW